MINTYYFLNQLETTGAMIMAFIIGLAFGSVLELAGFGSSKRLAGIFYFRDMTVVKVMFTAMLTALLSIQILEACGILEEEVLFLHSTYYGGAIVGGLVFGVGFVAGSWCPGTAAVGAASGKLDAWIFLGGSIVGVWFYDLKYEFCEPLSRWGNAGVMRIYETFDLPKSHFILLLVLCAIAVLFACEVWNPETRRPEADRLYRNRSLWLLSGFFLAAALLLPQITLFQSRQSVFMEIEDGRDHIDPEELAEILMDKPDSILLVDVRSGAEYRKFHLPGARNIEPSALPNALNSTRHNQPIVLYSNGMTHPAQLRNELVRRGYSNVRFLTDGLDGFLEKVARPASLRLAPMSETEEKYLQWWNQNSKLTL